MDAVSWAKTSLFGDQLQRLVVGRVGKWYQRILAAKVFSSNNLFYPSCPSILSEATLPMEIRSERYSLKVISDGSSTTLTANSTLEWFRGCLSQSFFWGSSHSLQSLSTLSRASQRHKANLLWEVRPLILLRPIIQTHIFLNRRNSSLDRTVWLIEPWSIAWPWAAVTA